MLRNLLFLVRLVRRQEISQAKGHRGKIQGETFEVCHDVLPKIPIKLSVGVCPRTRGINRYFLQGYRLIADAEFHLRLNINLSLHNPTRTRKRGVALFPGLALTMKSVIVAN